jgi:integrase
MVFRPVRPDPSEARERWLTRSEAARLIWAAWRQREVRNGRECGRHVSKHIARFILTSLYTGSRAGDICNAALMPTIGRGYVDTDSGLFRRKPDNKRETNKRQPTVPLPARLLTHIRRWRRLGISTKAVVEWNGEPVLRVSKGWSGVVEAAGLATEEKAQKVVPHTLRHTAISWYLRAGVPIDKVSDYCGVSVAIIKKVYKHHLPGNFDSVVEAAHGFGRTGRR